MVKKPISGLGISEQEQASPRREYNVISELSRDQDVVKRVSELARLDPRLDILRSVLMNHSETEPPQDQQSILRTSISVLTEMVIGWDQKLGGSALAARDNLLAACSKAPFKKTPKGRG